MTEGIKKRSHEACENTLAKLMAENGIVAKGSQSFRHPKTTIADPQARYSPKLGKGINPSNFTEIVPSSKMINARRFSHIEH